MLSKLKLVLGLPSIPRTSQERCTNQFMYSVLHAYPSLGNGMLHDGSAPRHSTCWYSGWACCGADWLRADLICRSAMQGKTS